MKIVAGVLRAHRKKNEFRHSDVLAFGPPGLSAGNVSERLADLETLGVVESRTDPKDGRRTMWSLVLDPEQAEIPTEERIID
jgi:DNA-binding HxlR family transcriptional regulator